MKVRFGLATTAGMDSIRGEGEACFRRDLNAKQRIIGT